MTRYVPNHFSAVLTISKNVNCASNVVILDHRHYNSNQTLHHPVQFPRFQLKVIADDFPKVYMGIKMTSMFCNFQLSVILLSNLDTLTTEDEVLNNFRTKPHLASIPIKTVKILRDPVTSISNGLCYIETNNVDEAIKFFSTLTHDALKIDRRTGKTRRYNNPQIQAYILKLNRFLVSVAYGRAFFFTTPKNNSVAVSALAAAQWTNCASAFPPSTSTSNVLPKAPCEEIKTEVLFFNLKISKLSDIAYPTYTLHKFLSGNYRMMWKKCLIILPNCIQRHWKNTRQMLFIIDSTTRNK